MKIKIDNEIGKLFKEERTIPNVSDELKKRGFENTKRNHWYSTWETTRKDITYSSIKLKLTNNDKNDDYFYPDGIRVLLIGVNPRATSDNYQKEIEEYCKDDSKHHRDGCNDYLEPTRKNALLDALMSADGQSKGVKELITIDLFAERTKTSNELFIKIGEQPSEINKIIGENNHKLLKDYIYQTDMIIIAWGSGINNTLWARVNDYRNNLYKWLSDNISKCRWYGANTDGTPKHISRRLHKNFQKLNKNELRTIFGL